MSRKRKADEQLPAEKTNSADSDVIHFPFEITWDKPIPACLTTQTNKQPSTVILFFHGSGGDMNSSNLASLSAEIVRADPKGCIAVLRVTTKPPNFGWRVKAAHATLEYVLKNPTNDVNLTKVKNVYLMGRSMGSRVAAKLAIESTLADKRCILLAFPFDNPEAKTINDEERAGLVAKLDELKIPMLFVAGDKDEFCPMDKLETALKLPDSHKEKLIFPQIGHSLTATSRAQTKALEQAIANSILHFITK